jgi:hypothetical protein
MNIELLQQAFKFPEAVSFYWNLLEIATIAEQKDVETVGKLPWLALVVIPDNPFYQQNSHRLAPLVQQALISGKPVREAFIPLAEFICLLTGGPEHAAEFAPQVREMLGG